MLKIQTKIGNDPWHIYFQIWLKALSVALKSDAIKAIEQWLLMANDEGKYLFIFFLKRGQEN